jgi:ATP-dependent Lon protease
VGGIKEKLLAAHRAGIQRIMLPKGNEDDLEDVPAEIREALEIILVETVEDVMRQALGLELPGPAFHQPPAPIEGVA